MSSQASSGLGLSPRSDSGMAAAFSDCFSQSIRINYVELARLPNSQVKTRTLLRAAGGAGRTAFTPFQIDGMRAVCLCTSRPGSRRAIKSNFLSIQLQAAQIGARETKDLVRHSAPLSQRCGSRDRPPPTRPRIPTCSLSPSRALGRLRCNDWFVGYHRFPYRVWTSYCNYRQLRRTMRSTRRNHHCGGPSRWPRCIFCYRDGPLRWDASS